MVRKSVHFTMLVALILCAGLPMVRAQESGSSQSSNKRQVTAYHLEFALNELDDGKKVNTRHYSMNLTDDGEGKDLKIGSRVPTQMEEGKFQYLDLGTAISARMVAWVTPLTLAVNAEVTSFAVPDENPRGGHPLLRQMRISGSTAVIPGKPTIIGSVDDPNSNRTFQLEVTATTIK